MIRWRFYTGSIVASAAQRDHSLRFACYLAFSNWGDSVGSGESRLGDQWPVMSRRLEMARERGKVRGPDSYSVRG